MRQQAAQRVDERFNIVERVVTLNGDAHAIAIVPADDGNLNAIFVVEAHLQRVEIAGEGVVIASMRVVEIGGDETVTTFSGVDTKRRFTAEESASLFSLPPARR